jgi:hypothetical protein
MTYMGSHFDTVVCLHLFHTFLDLRVLHRILLSPLYRNQFFNKLISASTRFECRLSFLEMRSMISENVECEPRKRRTGLPRTQVQRR